jgi:hypothetical protein
MPRELPPDLVDLAQKCRNDEVAALELRLATARPRPSDSERALAFALLAALAHGRTPDGGP